MKVKITCPKCNSSNIKITSEEGNPFPMYQCVKCGYKNKLFPGFESDNKPTKSGDKIEILGDEE